MKTSLFLALLAGGCLFGRAADPVFSGPQTGEKTTPFKTLELTGASTGQERDPVTANAGAPTALIFLHGVERSLAPLLRVLDQYGAERKDRLRSEVVFLNADRVAGEQRGKAASGSLKLQSRVGLSLDGAEGPGNYGLNKECLMTVVVAKENRVTANFALVQPGIVDAPKILAAMAKACGDDSPLTVERLDEKLKARAGPGRGEGRMNMAKGTNAPVADKFPGAVPEDPKLNTLLRQIIRPTNDNATVDKFKAEMEAHIKGNPELSKQASNGWVRVLHFGDRYGTAYSRQAGQGMLDQFKAAVPPAK